MISRKRLTRIVGVSVLTGATVLSQSGVAGATELPQGPTDTQAGVPGDHLKTLESKYGSSTITNIGSIANITAEDCANGSLTSIGSIVNVDKACADKINSIGSIVKVNTGKEVKTEVVKETKTETKTEVKKETPKEPAKKADLKTETKTEKPKTDKCDLGKDLSYNYSINGKNVGKSLAGVKAGDVVKVDFTIAEQCKDVELSLAAYDAPGATFSKDTASQQKLSDHGTGKFNGKGSLDVVIPECFYQMDFVRGGVIKDLSAKNLYGERLISSINGGQECVAPVEVPKTPETPAPAPKPVVEVQEVQLARTGVETSHLVTLGSALLLMGVAFDRASKRMRTASQATVAA